MNLGKEVAGKFMVLFGVGAVVIFTAFVVAMIPGSPYSMGQPGSPYISVHLGSGLLLVWSGMVGAILSQVTEVHAARYRRVVGAGVLQGVFLVIFLGSAWTTYETVSDQVPVFVSSIGVALAVLAAGTWVQSTRYLLRVYRLHRPYRELD